MPRCLKRIDKTVNPGPFFLTPVLLKKKLPFTSPKVESEYFGVPETK